MTNPDLYWIEAFLAGTRPASNGVSTTITRDNLQDVVDTYNPQIFRAPLIVSKNFGHDIGNYTDITVSEEPSELCHGIPAKLKLVGDRLYAGYDKLSRNIAKWLRDKQIHSFSSSFYLPNSPNNPYQGNWSLRHIVGLGATPPACKGLAPPPEPPSDWEEFDSYAIKFNENEEGVVNFDMYVGATSVSSPWAIASDLFQGLREWLIESKDVATADRVLPSDQISALRDMATSDALKNQQILQLQMQVAQLQADADADDDDDDDDSDSNWQEGEEMDYKAAWKKSKMTPAEVADASGLSEEEVSDICAKGKMPTPKQKKALDKVFNNTDRDSDTASMNEQLEKLESDLKAREEALAKLAEGIANRERALEYREVSSFVETLVGQGKIKAVRRDDTITLLMNTPNTTEIEFSQATGKKTPRQALMAEFNDRPVWNFNDTIVKDEQDPVNPDFSDGRSLPGATSESVQQHHAVVGWCKKHGKDPDKSADYSEAMMALRILY